VWAAADVQAMHSPLNIMQSLYLDYEFQPALTSGEAKPWSVGATVLVCCIAVEVETYSAQLLVVPSLRELIYS
jgi:hypothetical protein